ncbi:MAG: ribosome assembly factor SBDS [Candidatus Aenigmatarchaeota archaeon]|nr:MAG: ribosome assembly factor SBDS [Candidatus Aenigmarchaeota archaeon]
MVSLDEAVIARLSKNNLIFEILVDPNKALRIKKGENISMDDVLAVPEIFKDARKGERVSEQDLTRCFGTLDVFRIAEEIIKDGEVQITTEQKREMIEERKKEIADIISKQGINPQTKLPHPPTRIMAAMEEARVNIDPFRPAKDQVKNVVSEIQRIIPIAFEKLEIMVKVPMEYAGRVSSVIRNMVDIKKEEWKSDGWVAVIEIPAGMQSDVYDKLNNMTSGKVEVKVLSEKQI